jgi:N-acetylglucosamine-6-sulfatase
MQSRNWLGCGAIIRGQRCRRVSLTLVVMALLVQGVTIQVQAADTRVRPNIVVVLVDDLRWDDIGCAGHPFVRTPHIDRIAREGVRFRNAFCTTPLCSPVRACLLTGLHTHHHGILDNVNRSEQSHRLKTFPQELQRSGYTTAYVGKWHMGNDDTARPGFDRWVGIKGQGTSFDPVLNVDGERVKFTGHTTDVLNRQAVEFVRRKKSKPFCLYVAHKALHPELTQRDDGSITDPKAARFLPARRHSELYADAAIPRRLNVTDTLQGKPALLRKIEGLPVLSRATGTSDETVRDRLRMLAGVDDGVGLLLDELKANGELDKTVFVFTSDHGYWYGEHGLSVERRLAYEEALRIPLLIRFPPLIRPGSIVDEFALSIDLAPTLLELAGTTSSQRMDGRSVVPLLKGPPAADWRSSFLIQYNTDTVFPRVKTMGYRAIRTKRWKFIRYLELDGMDELYDLRADPYEMTNIVSREDVREVVKRLNQELDALLDDPG